MKLIIQTAELDMKQELAAIWSCCHGDSTAYTDMFLGYRFNPQDTLVAVVDSKPVGAVYLLRASQVGGNNIYYVYAVGVMPQYRGRGIFRSLMNSVMERAKKDEYDCVLVPSLALVAYYQSIGMELSYTYEEFTALQQTSNSNSMEKIARFAVSASDCKAMRDAHFNKKGSVIWNERDIEYALVENRFCGGFSDRIVYPGGEGYLFGNLIDGKLHISETSFSRQTLSALSNALINLYGASEMTAVLPSTGHNGKPYAMTTNKKISGGAWLGLTLI